MTNGYLVDTSVLSLLAPERPTLDKSLASWMRAHNDQLYVSAVTVAEIEQGIRKLHRAGGVQRADALTRWLDALIERGGDRILPFDTRAGRIAGELSDQAIAAGRHPGFADVAIAATAVANGLVVLTRNGKHFAPLGVELVDPVERLPD